MSGKHIVHAAGEASGGVSSFIFGTGARPEMQNELLSWEEDAHTRWGIAQTARGFRREWDGIPETRS
jgi:hypothetical protein